MDIGDEDEVLEAGTDSQGTEGQDPEPGDDEADLSAEQPDGEEDDGQSEVAEGAGKPSRGETRFQKLANETKAAREEAAEARREAAELRRQGWQQQQTRSAEEEQQRLAYMTPDERAEYRIRQSEARQTSERQQDRVQFAATMDKVAFDAKAAANPVYARHREAVETKFQDQLRQGKPVEREILLKLHLGDLALQGASKSGAQRKQAASRVQSQRVAPTNGKGDAASPRARAGDTAESRLRNVII